MRPQRLVYDSLLAAGLTLRFAPAAFADVHISVDKTNQKMTVSVDGVMRYVWPVSTGRPGYDTPGGRFHPLWMSVLHHSTLYDDAPMPDSIFFARGYAIHGFTDTPFGAAAVSHGCVRLPRRDAAALGVEPACGAALASRKSYETKRRAAIDGKPALEPI